jgi:hypothetical protein
MKVLGIADSDSYTKWGASILSRMPAAWSRRLVVIRTPALPSATQLDSALTGTGFSRADSPLHDLHDLAALVAQERPDVVLLSVRGPVVRVLVRMIVAAGPHRPLIVSGLPGISIPATLLALYYRSQVDLLILHSKREIDEFAALAASWGIRQEFALATLPFLSELTTGRGGTDIVFAAQAKVPRTLEDREQLLGWLAETARAWPDRRVILKLRGISGEAQTHSERYPFDVLLAGLVDRPDNLVVSIGPMSEHLESAAALVTVSSTAAIEAIAMGIPVLALDDFGVSGSLINLVFEGSGVLGSSRQLVAGDVRSPRAEWLDSNYFHSASDESWVSAIEAGVARRANGPLPLRAQFRATLGGNLRRIWDRKRALGAYDTSVEGYLALAVGLPLRGTVRLLRRARAKLRPATDPAAAPRAGAGPGVGAAPVPGAASGAGAGPRAGAASVSNAGDARAQEAVKR